MISFVEVQPASPSSVPPRPLRPRDAWVRAAASARCSDSNVSRTREARLSRQSVHAGPADLEPLGDLGRSEALRLESGDGGASIFGGLPRRRP